MPAIDRTLEEYLDALRAGLRGLPEGEIAEIVAEIRSHVIDSMAARAARAGADDGTKAPPGAGAMAAVLDGLGTADELAERYQTGRMLERAERSASPFMLFGGLLRWATISGAGMAAFAALVTGFTLAGSLALAAILKPFAPGRVGLWRYDDSWSLRMGFGAPGPGREVLGWWIVPLGLLAGAAGYWLTGRLARWFIRRFRRPPVTGVGA